MKRNEPGMFLCRALVSLIVVLMIGFLGLGVRAFATADTTQFIFFAACVISVAILALYFMLRRPTREPTGHSLFREPPFVEPLFLRLCTIGGNPLNLDHLSERASPGEAGTDYARSDKPLSRTAAGGVGNSSLQEGEALSLPPIHNYSKPELCA